MRIGAATRASSSSGERRPAAASWRRGRRGRARTTLDGRVGRGAEPADEDQECGDREQLEDRQRGRGLEVEQLGGEQVDLGLDRGVAQPAEGQHDAERRRAEQEHHAGGADTIAGRSAGRVTVRNTCAGVAPERGRGLARPRVERLPGGADRADHDRDVEEGEAGDDRDRRPVEAQEAERPGLADQQPEGDADHDGRQHERHQQQRADDAAEREGQPVQDVRRGQPEQHASKRRQPGRPDREPQHPVGARPGQHLGHAAGVELAVRRRSPRPIIPLTGSTKKTASTSTGPSARPTRVRSRRSPHSAGDVAPLASATRRGARRSRPGRRRRACSGCWRELRPVRRQRRRRRRPGRRTSRRAAPPGTAG